MLFIEENYTVNTENGINISKGIILGIMLSKYYRFHVSVSKGHVYWILNLIYFHLQNDQINVLCIAL